MEMRTSFSTRISCIVVFIMCMTMIELGMDSTKNTNHTRTVDFISSRKVSTQSEGKMDLKEGGRKLLIKPMTATKTIPNQSFAITKTTGRERKVRQMKKNPTEQRCTKRLPTVIIIGVEKSGTSALLLFLNSHPMIKCLTHPEEARFFTKNYSKGLTYYKDLMPCSTDDDIVIEKTPGYFYKEEAAMRIHKFNKKMKLIVIMKDPVERSISAYAMYKAQNKMAGLDFGQACLVNGTSEVNTHHPIIKNSLYINPLKVWLEIFNQENFLFLDGNNFKKDPSSELNKVEQFLSLSSYFTPASFYYNKGLGKICQIRPMGATNLFCLTANKGRQHPIVPDKVLAPLHQYFDPLNKEMFDMIGENFNWTYPI